MLRIDWIDNNGTINGKKLLEMYNNHPNVTNAGKTISHDQLILPPDLMQFRIVVNNSSGNFSG